MEKYKQNIAVDMRRRGFSYSEIESRLHIPKSTLSYWLKNIKLTPEQNKKLNDKRTEVAKANALKKISRTSKIIEEIKKSSSRDIKKISKKELWLMGIMLYWKNGNKNDLKKGVHFSSSDSSMIRLFLKWLKEIGEIDDKEIKFNVFMPGHDKNSTNKKTNFTDEVISYWSKITGFPGSRFSNVYLQNIGRKKVSNGKNSKFGFLRVKVAQSSMLARQIAGWIEGLKNINNLK